MKLTRLPMAQPKPDGGAGRESGVHFSDPLKFLLVSMDPKRYGGVIDDEAALRFELGFSWEEVALRVAFLKRLRGVQGLRFAEGDCEFQTPVRMDGIIGTPDGAHLPSKRILEAKLTFISAINPLSGPRFWHHRVQAMWYAAARGWNEAIFLYCFMGGDYRPMRPQTQSWLLQFTDEELEGNRRMIRGAVEDMQEAVRKGVYPPKPRPKQSPKPQTKERALPKDFWNPRWSS